MERVTSHFLYAMTIDYIEANKLSANKLIHRPLQALQGTNPDVDHRCRSRISGQRRVLLEIERH